MTGAEQECLGGMFNNTKVAPSYLLGLNNRPFDAGANATLKRRMLELFLLTDPINNPVLAKYMCRIARAWQMPCEKHKADFFF